MAMTTSRDLVLAENGWTVECESPFELRHDDGSFASGLAAEFVVEALERGAANDKRLTALQTIAGTANLARRTGDATNRQLWEQVLLTVRDAL